MFIRATTGAFLLVVAAAGPAAADTGPHCGDNIMESITLTANLVCHGTALTVPGPGPRTKPGHRVRIDFDGHTIKGDGTGVGVAMYSGFQHGHSGVDLVDGTITGFSSALISAERIFPGPGDLTLTRMKFLRNDQWVSFGSNDDIGVRDSEFIDTGAGGPGSDSDMIITNSKFVRSSLIASIEGNTFIYNSRLTGGSIDSHWLVAVGNTITSCYPASRAGINVNYGSALIQGNTVSKCGVGIRVGPLEQPAIVDGNTLSKNAREGLIYDKGRFNRATTIVGNLFARNGADGLNGIGNGPVAISGNTATKNAGHGMNVIGTHITDGGGNTAVRNSTDPQCVGLTCS